MKILSLLAGHNHDKRNISIYLTNTLGSTEEMEVDMIGTLAQEVKKASVTKSTTPVMVVIGNPPWSAINKTKLDTNFIKDKMEIYKKIKVPGTHSLADPYVMFMRFAQYKIEQNGSGIVGMIVNNSFLNKSGFESMRRALAQTFDKILIYNLHGNSKTKHGDKNVFDITITNTIILMIKLPIELSANGTCVIKYDEIFGSRELKFKSLTSRKNNWKTLHPENTRQFLFIPYRENKLYENGLSLDQIFQTFFTGSNTHHDDFAIAFDKKTLKNRILDMVDTNIPDREFIMMYKLNKKYDVGKIRSLVRREGYQEKLIHSYAYRPFDYRYGYFSKHVMGARREFYDDVVDTLSICAPKLSNSNLWTAIHIANGMADIKFCEYATPSHMFPLTLKKQSGYTTLLDGSTRITNTKLDSYNFSDNFIHFITRKYGSTINGEDIFYYIYAILHSPIYRDKYSQYLKQSLPKIPFFDKPNTDFGDLGFLKKISGYGKELIHYHTMTKTMRLSDDNIKWIRNKKELRRPVIKNDEKMISVSFKNYTVSNIPLHIWKFEIGGRCVLNDLIKKRFSKLDEIRLRDRQYFLKVCGNLAKTIEIQSCIDKSLSTYLPKHGDK